MQASDRLVIAVDFSASDEILQLVDELHGIAGVFKIGLQAFVANGPAIVREVVARGEKVFLDLKIHDIPNTAGRAVAEAAALGASMITVHAAGGEAMLRATAAAAPAEALILGVTILTSLDDADLPPIGFAGSLVECALRLAQLSKAAGLRGVVSSPREIEAIRATMGDEFVILTPGIRPAGSESGDQRRTLTPAEAVAAGADYIVVGRPITAAADPAAAAKAILAEISGSQR